MKRLFLCFIALLAVICTYAQEVTVKENGYVYVPHPILKKGLQEHIDKGGRFITNVFLPNYDKVLVKKAKSMEVIGYAATSNDYMYNLYVVKYKGSFAFVCDDSVLDNSSIGKASEDLKSQYDALREAEGIRLFKNEKERLLQECKDSIEMYKREIVNLDDKASDIADQFAKVKRDSLSALANYCVNRLEEFSEKNKKVVSALVITKAVLSSGNSVGGHDVLMSYFNKSEKTIKYLHWTANVRNAVGDKVECTVKGDLTFKGKDTGPIESKKLTSATWENVIYNTTANKLEITSIMIEYMDGTSVILSRQDVGVAIEAGRTLESYGEYKRKFDLYNSTSTYAYKDLKTKAENMLKAEGENAERMIKKWENRYKMIDSADMLMMDTFDTSLSAYKKLYKGYKDASARLNQFENTMNLK